MAASSDSPPAPVNSDDFPARGRLLGIDFGTRRLGFAVCNLEQTIASPVANYTRSSLELDARRLRQIVAEYSAVGLVVGLPVHMSGDEGGKAREARTFGAWASAVTGLPVRYGDERYSSLIAEQRLLDAELSMKKRKARLDMLAAQHILQGYLDRSDRTATPGPL